MEKWMKLNCAHGVKMMILNIIVVIINFDGFSIDSIIVRYFNWFIWMRGRNKLGNCLIFIVIVGLVWWVRWSVILNGPRWIWCICCGSELSSCRGWDWIWFTIGNIILWCLSQILSCEQDGMETNTLLIILSASYCIW